MSHRTTIPSPSAWLSLCRVATITAALVPALARAEVEWHADLETAHAAARISHRPVLAVFVASWGVDTFETTCLGSAEAEAVLATCFEPVRIDIDERPELTRATRVTHVPTACVLAADDAVLASFEMPDSPAAFVTAAILAAQRAAEAEHGTIAVAGETRQPAAAAAHPGTAFGSASEPAAAAANLARGSMARVTAKVRDLSAFARSQSLPTPAAQPVVISQASRAVTESGPASAPLTWPAEQASVAPTAAAPAPAIEPATLTPTTVAPWLDTPPAQAPPQRTAAVPAPGTPATTPAPLPATAQPAPPAAPQPTGLIAALQKPFGLGPKPADPPTLPPALPRGPFADAPQAPAAPAAADGETATAGVAQGSMPLGLEGYCPVTLVDRGTWLEGRAQWGARHRGRTYLFAGENEQRAFLADPDRYAPALSGDDPVLALDRGSSTPGQRRYGVTYQSRMYLFATPETRQEFSADPGRYAARIAVAERTPTTGAATRTY